jgi:hypothetical protein
MYNSWEWKWTLLLFTNLVANYCISKCFRICLYISLCIYQQLLVMFCSPVANVSLHYDKYFATYWQLFPHTLASISLLSNKCFPTIRQMFHFSRQMFHFSRQIFHHPLAKGSLSSDRLFNYPLANVSLPFGKCFLALWHCFHYPVASVLPSSG